MFIGSVLGDGTIQKTQKETHNPHLTVYNTNKEYLEHLEEIAGPFGASVDIHRTAEEQNEQTTFGNEKRYGNCSDLFRFQTVRHPDLQKLYWIEDEVVHLPEWLEFTPTVTKHWFCQDGSSQYSGRGNKHFRAMIKCVNLKPDYDTAIKKFHQVGVRPAEHDYYREYGSVSFPKWESYKLFEHMGEAPPGMEYKWPDD